MARCTAPVQGHRTASGRAACPACGGGSYRYRAYSSPSPSPSYSSSASSGRSTRSSTRSLTSALPKFREVPLSSVPSLLRDDPPDSPDRSPREYDVFISHASEDKDEIVRPLAEALIAENLRVWYDEFTLRIGDSLRQKIDRGLANSKVGLVVLSHTFIDKGWTNYELDGIVSRTVSGEQILLPIWHNISKDEVQNYSPSLADKVARSTATHTVAEIATEISELIRGVHKTV